MQYVAHPGGSLRDGEVTAAADQYGMIMVHISAYWQQTVVGLIIIIAIVMAGVVLILLFGIGVVFGTISVWAFSHIPGGAPRIGLAMTERISPACRP